MVVEKCKECSILMFGVVKSNIVVLIHLSHSEAYITFGYATTILASTTALFGISYLTYIFGYHEEDTN